jgi:putative Holliday junction resolvase
MSTPIIALDVGARRTGVAVSDPDRRIALPLETVESADARAAVARVLALMDARGCDTVVAGWPLNMQGKEGRATRRVDAFLTALSQAAGREVTIVRWDERLTTTAAESELVGQGMRRSRRKEVVDQLAATHILEGYLRSLARGGADG